MRAWGAGGKSHATLGGCHARMGGWRAKLCDPGGKSCVHGENVVNEGGAGRLWCSEHGAGCSAEWYSERVQECAVR